MYGCGGGQLICSSFNIGQLPWHVDTALMGMVFMLVGYYLKKKGYIYKMNLENIILLFTIGSISILRNDVTVSTLDNQLGNIILFYTGAVALSVASLTIGYRFLGQSHTLAFWGEGKHTLVFMAFNYFLNFVFDVLWKMFFGAADIFCKWCFKAVFVLLMCSLIIFCSMSVKRIRKSRV